MPGTHRKIPELIPLTKVTKVTTLRAGGRCSCMEVSVFQSTRRVLFRYSESQLYVITEKYLMTILNSENQTSKMIIMF